MQGVEPAPGLIHRFADEICRELLLECIRVFKRIMPLRNRHGTGIEPHINQFRNPIHLPTTFFTTPAEFIHVRAMQIQVAEIASYPFRQLSHRADTFLRMALITFPDRQRRSPITFASQRPVHIIGQPVAKPAILDVTGIPVDFIVQRHKAVFKLAGTDIPGGTGIIQKRCITTPAEGIRVGVCPGTE